MERTIRAIKMHYRRISGRKNWNQYLLRYGRCVASHAWWEQQTDGEALLTTVYTRAGVELTDPQEGCKLKDIKIKSSGEQPCLGVRQ